MDASTALEMLRLQLAWGADEAIAEAPVDRLASPPVALVPAPRPVTHMAAAATPPVVQRAVQAAQSASSIAALRAALAGFDGCALRDTALSLVFEDGNPAATIMLIGEAPGAEDERAGVPLTGPDGQYLDRMLDSIGLDRTKLLLTTLIPWRPPGNRKPSETEVASCLPFLHRHIALRGPALLVLLGSLPARALLGTAAERRRGRAVLRPATIPGLDRTLPALTLAHPATIRASPAARRDAWADLRLLRRTIDGQLTKN